MNAGRKSAPRPIASREFAYQLLSEFEQSGEFLSSSIDSREHELAERDRPFVRNLIQTVVRRKLTLEAVLRKFVTRDVDPGLWILLKLGSSQLLFGNQKHRHADLNETVEVARSIGQPRWCGFLNGVLRNISRELTDETGTQALDGSWYPSEAAGLFRKLKRPVFPDPQSEFQQYLSVAYSLPAWLIERWSRRWNREELQAISVWFLHPQPLCLRVNRMLASRDEILATFASQKIRCFPGTLADSLVGLPSGASVVNLPGWNEGHFSVQDETAQHAALTLDPQPGESVLDLCAAPGTKTTHLAEMMQNRGTIIATDVSEDRLEKVRDNARRLQLEIIQTVQIDRDGINIPDGPFDAILIDAPCTNTGVLGKRIEARWRITPRDIEELSTLQQRLLQQAADRVRPGGRILYSTCSIEPEENEHNLQHFLASRPEFELRSERSFRPGDPSDGGYQALLVRTA